MKSKCRTGQEAGYLPSLCILEPIIGQIDLEAEIRQNAIIKSSDGKQLGNHVIWRPPRDPFVVVHPSQTRHIFPDGVEHH